MSSSVEDHGLVGSPRVRKLSDGVYAYVQPDGSWWINNTGFLVGRRGVVSIDACSTERRTRAYLEAIARVSDRPVGTLVNTHHHGDHTFGNYLFGGATIVAHERTREEVLASGLPGPQGVAAAFPGVEWGTLEVAPPFLTYTDRVTLHVDELRCELRHIGAPAHTTNDSVVWIPEHSLLFAGDLVWNGGTPFVLMGSVAGSVRACEELQRLGPRTIVPGHGNPCGPEVIGDVLGYLRFVQDLAARGRDAGLSPLETARETDLGPYAELLDPERIVGNLHRAYAELDGAEPGTPIDVPAAIRDMITYNGGESLTCYA